MRLSALRLLRAWFVIGRLNPGKLQRASTTIGNRSVGWDHRAVLFYRY
jgi:hypothetical protein